MTENLQDLTNFALVGFTFTALIAPLIIWGLYKMNIVVRHVLTGNKMNQEFINIHAHKSGTPTMGGLMIMLTVLVWAIILIPASPVKTVFLIGWVLTGLYGFVEGAMVFARKVDEKFKLLQETFGWRIGKLIVLYAICLICLFLIRNVIGITEITLIGSLVLPLNALVILLGAAGMVLSLYGMEITDGADGLVTGQFIVAFIAYIAIVGVTGHTDLLPYLGLMLGSAFVYLYFNINPARVFMGGTGTLPIGFALVLFSIVTDTLLPFIIMGMIFWIELFSSASQIIAIKFFNTKIFRIAPIHHHFEATGWPESKVVQRFWLGSAVAALAALWLFSSMV
jgi:phospho-N-acetylmuramoyl-pentapeptide-transferase